MSNKRGGSSFTRQNPRNFVGNTSDKRFQEVVKQHQNQGLQTLKVDSFEVLYFKRLDCNQVCTCIRSQLPESDQFQSDDSAPINAIVEQNGSMEYRINHYSSMFGVPNTTGVADDAEPLMDELLDESIVDDVDSASLSNPFGSGVDCGICYRTGLVPGYELYGFNRKVYASQHAISAYGYSINYSKYPNCFDKTDPEQGFVIFEVEVPFVFQGIAFSIRNNNEVLEEERIYSASAFGTELTKADFISASGNKLQFAVYAEQFTHVVLTFDMGTERVKANLAQTNKTNDWTLFNTIGNIGIILPQTISEVATSDVIYVPSRNYMFKISDFSYMKTALGAPIEWQVQTRIIQPQENLINIVKSMKLY